MSQAVHRVAKALARAAQEHGIPNGIGPAELSAYYTNLRPMQIGLVLNRQRAWLNELLAPHGVRVTSYEQGFDGMRIGLDEADGVLGR